MNWKHLLESASESVNDDLRLRNDYLLAENRILRNQMNGRVQLTDSERKELAEIEARLGKKALEEIATIATPDTILAWNRKFANEKVDTSERPKAVGRPRVDQEIEDLVIRMARENRSWGYDRIQGALMHLGYAISDQTVGNILKRHHIPPAPERKKTVTWREFIRCHVDILLATNFFHSDVWNGLMLMVFYLLRVVHVSRHPVQLASRTLHWQIQGIQVLIGCFTLDLRVSIWACFIPGQSRVIRMGELVLGEIVSEVMLAGTRESQPQDVGTVIDLTAARHRQKRDGPEQRSQGINGQRSARRRKAA